MVALHCCINILNCISKDLFTNIRVASLYFVSETQETQCHYISVLWTARRSQMTSIHSHSLVESLS